MLAGTALLFPHPGFSQDNLREFEKKVAEAAGGAAIPESWIAEALEMSRQGGQAPPVPEYERTLVSRIRQKILLTEAPESFEDYIDRSLGGEELALDMVAIEGGTFLMGSPPEEEGRQEDEGPQREVEVSPFWMARYETTWLLYHEFTGVGGAPNKNGHFRNHNGTPKTPHEVTDLPDWVSAPTTAYTQMDFGMGQEDRHPAVNMTQHAANKFCQWLSARTGHYYRLPTEAEWEYACRAGTTGPYSCPADQLADHAVMDPEMVRTGYEKVGTKKPNPWGLRDMHGNVMEWCLDQFAADAYRKLPSKDPKLLPTKLYPRVARGGSWFDPPEELRSARRLSSGQEWKAQDAELPKSLWHLTDAPWLGFRVVRPVEIPSEEEMFAIWNSAAIRQPYDAVE